MNEYWLGTGAILGRILAQIPSSSQKVSSETSNTLPVLGQSAVGFAYWAHCNLYPNTVRLWSYPNATFELNQTEEEEEAWEEEV